MYASCLNLNLAATCDLCRLFLMAMVAALKLYKSSRCSSASVERLTTLSAQYTAPSTWPTLCYVQTSFRSCLSNYRDTESGFWGEAGFGSF